MNIRPPELNPPRTRGTNHVQTMLFDTWAWFTLKLMSFSEVQQLVIPPKVLTHSNVNGSSEARGKLLTAVSLHSANKMHISKIQRWDWINLPIAEKRSRQIERSNQSHANPNPAGQTWNPRVTSLASRPHWGSLTPGPFPDSAYASVLTLSSLCNSPRPAVTHW